MKRVGWISLLIAGIEIFLPYGASAQVTDVSIYVGGLQKVLEAVRLTMNGYMWELTATGQAFAGLGALFYISYRVWGHLARAESIDFFPLLRPLAIGIVLTCYSGLMAGLNDILQVTVSVTDQLVQNTNAAIANVLSQNPAEAQALVSLNGNGNEEAWDQYGDDGSAGSGSGLLAGISNAVSFKLDQAFYFVRSASHLILAQILEFVYEAAALCVNTLRTFELILLAILGPLVLGLSVWDGFRHLLVAWLSRYINVFLWLPVANIFAVLIGHIQVAMIQYDNNQTLANGQPGFGATDTAYLIFLLMGTIGYFCVPSITNHIINVFPSGGGAFQRKASGAMMSGAATATKVAGTIL
jgi:conjugative transposon TraJ protein